MFYIRYFLFILIIFLFSCSENFVQRDFWFQIYPKIPKEQFDPFKGKCTFISEEWKSFGTVDDVEIWVVRHYMCSDGII